MADDFKAKNPPHYSQELLDQIRSAVNIVDVVGEHVVLRKTGTNHLGLCPFHSERTPSFNVQESKQFYHCFGCKRSGDIFTFVRDLHALSFPEAVEELAERAKIPFLKSANGAERARGGEAGRRNQEQREKVSMASRLNLFAAYFYMRNLQSLPALEYVFKRGAGSPELQHDFSIGAADPHWDSLARHLAKAKAPLELAVELGLIQPSTRGAVGGTGFFDLFRNRVIFPIHDLRGKVLGFGGRALPSDSEESPGPKYLNSRESFIFKKNRVAYGLFQAQKHVRELDEIIVVEGYFDVLALHSAGFRNVVATCGTALSVEHLSLFKRLATRIVILFDGDRAGLEATERAMELGLEHGLALYGARMPENLDPDEILFDANSGQLRPDGQSQMSAILSSAKPLIDVRIEEARLDAARDPESRAQAIKRIGGWLARFKDPVGQAVRLQEAEKALGVSAQLLVPSVLPQAHSPGGFRGAPKPLPRVEVASVVPSVQQRVQVRKRLSSGDKILLRGLAQGGALLEAAKKSKAELPPEATLADLFDHPSAQELVRAALLTDSLHLNPNLMAHEDIDPQVLSTLAEAWMSPQHSFSITDFKLALDRGLARAWARFSHRIKLALSDAEAKKDAGLHSRLMKDYLDVQRKMKEFSSFYDED